MVCPTCHCGSLWNPGGNPVPSQWPAHSQLSSLDVFSKRSSLPELRASGVFGSANPVIFDVPAAHFRQDRNCTFKDRRSI